MASSLIRHQKRCFLAIVVSTVVALLLVVGEISHIDRSIPIIQKPVIDAEFLITEGANEEDDFIEEAPENGDTRTAISADPIFTSEKDSVLMQMFETRRQQVKSACIRRFGFFNEPLKNNVSRSIAPYSGLEPYRFILLDEKHKILYCSVPKAASTTWRRFFIQIGSGGLAHRNNFTDSYLDDWNATWPHLKPLSAYANESYATFWRRIKPYKKIIWVRDPLNRLISAWRSKFQLKNEFYWQKIGRSIMKLLWNAGDKEKEEGGPVPLKAFFRFLYTGAKDVHWEPVYKLCLPCHLNYDYIGHLEGGEVEANFVIRRTTGQSDFLLPNSSTSALTQNFFKEKLNELAQLPRQVLKGIMDAYAADYEMFGYAESRNWVQNYKQLIDPDLPTRPPLIASRKKIANWLVEWRKKKENNDY